MPIGVLSRTQVKPSFSPWEVTKDSSCSPTPLGVESLFPRVGSENAIKREGIAETTKSPLKSKLKDAILGKTHLRTKSDFLSKAGLKSSLKFVGRMQISAEKISTEETKKGLKLHGDALRGKEHMSNHGKEIYSPFRSEKLKQAARGLISKNQKVK